MVIENQKTVVLWYLEGCIATFYELQDDKKKVPIDTVCFRDKAYLAFRQVDILRIASPAVQFLRNLTSLQVQNNNLNHLPTEIWRLSNLEQLNIGSNKITELPIEIGLLVHLKELYIHNNLITTIPTQVSNLKQLTVLDVTDNKLNYLPGELFRMDLKNLWLDNNPFKQQPLTSSFISLKTICIQTIGTTCIHDELSRNTIQDVDLLQQQSELFIVTLDLLPKCYHCSNYLFHSNLIKIIVVDKIPRLFKACSQHCLININRD